MRPARVVEAGDHRIVLLELVSFAFDPDIEPALFHRSAFRGIAVNAVNTDG
ncbi:MAG: hypothetical protein HOW97_24980 [Catenulispora sp.]|nr:hypothetical protein [Catenulispora sp.]